ncbi:MAG: hypothetical protein RBQ97_09660 [Acholeplasma sp.]|nr:hypothetical protein [Acholeplasma sp.]
MSKYEEGFAILGIKANELPKNYNPEEYGKELLKDTKNNQNVGYNESTSNITFLQLYK